MVVADRWSWRGEGGAQELSGWMVGRVPLWRRLTERWAKKKNTGFRMKKRNMKYVVTHIHIKIENHADWGNECITNMRIQPDSEKKLKINQSKDQAVRRCKTYMKCRVRVRVNQEAQKKKRNPE